MLMEHQTTKPERICFVSSICPQPLVQDCLGKPIFQLGPDSLILHSRKNLVLQEIHSLFKLIFSATQLKQRPGYDIFQKALFYTLASSKKLRLNAVPIVAGQYL